MAIHSALLDKIQSYKIPKRAIELLSDHKPMIIAGVTGAGKNVTLHHITAMSDWRHVVTHTTRRPRPDEKNGQNYWFVSEEQMLKLMEQEAMIEVNVVHGHTVYGTSIKAYEDVLQAAHNPALVIDVQGIQDIMLGEPDLRPVFLLPPNFDEWLKRLDMRGAMSHVERLRRLETAKAELALVLKDERFNLIVNHDIAATAETVVNGLTDQPTQRRNRELVKMLIDHINSY